jgi:ferredoxin-type protein NapH
MLIVLATVILLTVVLGKVFCSWICPVAPLRSLLNIAWKRHNGGQKQKDDVERKASLTPSTDTEKVAASCQHDCASCAAKREKLDSRHIILGGSLLSAAIFGFPVFCLLCPIGLIFGTIIVVWQFIGFEDVSLSLLIYPALLVVELLVLRKWCARFCPLGALLSLLSLPNRLFRPQVSSDKCLRAKGSDCSICCTVCPEGLDPHFRDSMNECSKCGICVDKCPAAAITIPFKSHPDPVSERLPDTRA